jgi:hypothetical protein
MVGMTEDIQTKYNAIKGADFDTSKKDISLAISVEGLEGTGKTHFALLTCPLPIVHINFSDRDANIFLYDMDEERRKQVTLYSDPFQAKTSQGWTRAEGQAALAALSEIAQDHLANGKMKGGTFVLDSGSSFWEVVQEVYVAPQQEKRQSEGGKRSGGLEYMQGNLIVNGVISWLKQQGAHVILTHRKRQDWDAKGPIPGQFSAQLNKKVPYLVEVRLDLYKTCEVCGSEFCEKKGHQGRKHWGRIVKFGRNTQMEGMCFENPSFDLVYNLYAAGNGGGN